MDHKSLYAHHIAQAIKHKRAMAKAEDPEPAEDDLDMEPAEEGEDLPPVDPVAARKERLKRILSR